MKHDFYFIHGWGFDKNFWRPVKEKLYYDGVSNSSEIIDLNFFLEKKCSKIKLKNRNSIVVVHSYGLHYFLKKRVKCKVLINFFGVPNFISFQNNSNTIKKKLIKMINQFQIQPENVLNNFYKKCNVHPENFERINFHNLNYSLKELLVKDYVSQFKRQNSWIFSVYCNKDKILDVNKEKIRFLEKQNHFIRFIDGFNHGFPHNEPELCSKLIKKLIRNI